MAHLPMHKVHHVVSVAVVFSLTSTPSALHAALPSATLFLPAPQHGPVGSSPLDTTQELLAIESAPPGPSILHHAVSSGDVEQVKQIVASSPRLVNQQHSRGNLAPLHDAVDNGNTEIVKVLIAAGADLDNQRFDGRTPLHMAVSRGSIDIVKVLLAEGAYVDPVDHNYTTPLHIAAYLGHAEIVDLLLGAGASIHARKRHDVTPLHMAASNGRLEVAKRLVLHARFNYRASAYFWPSYLQSPAVPPNVEEAWGMPRNEPYYMHRYNTPRFVSAFVSVQDHDGHSALHRSVYSGHTETAELLIEAGADINAQDKVGNTALHAAALQGREQATRVLIRAGAHVNISNNDGQTPLDLAHEQQHIRLMAALAAAGGERGGQVPGEKRGQAN